MFGFRSKFGADLAAAATASCSFVPNRLPGHRNECVVPLLGLPSGCRGRRSCRCLLSWMQRWLLHEWLRWLIEHSLTGSRSQIVFRLSVCPSQCLLVKSFSVATVWIFITCSSSSKSTGVAPLAYGVIDHARVRDRSRAGDGRNWWTRHPMRRQMRHNRKGKSIELRKSHCFCLL